jgi:hypothetical protein
MLVNSNGPSTSVKKKKEKGKSSLFQVSTHFFIFNFNIRLLTETLSFSHSYAIKGANVPIFLTKKEPFEWLMSGKKTIDIRKGHSHHGEFAVYLSGKNVLRLKIIKKETGKLGEMVRTDNFRLIIPLAVVLDDALSYLYGLYPGYDDVFTAYYVAP